MEETTVTIASIISDAGDAITSAMGLAWNFMTANPLLIVFCGAGLLTLGFAFFKKAKRTAR